MRDLAGGDSSCATCAADYTGNSYSASIADSANPCTNSDTDTGTDTGACICAGTNSYTGANTGGEAN